MLSDFSGCLPLRQSQVLSACAISSLVPANTGSRRNAIHMNRIHRPPFVLDYFISNAFQAIPTEVLYLKEFVDPQVRSFSPETALLHTTEGCDLVRYQPAVDPDHA